MFLSTLFRTKIGYKTIVQVADYDKKNIKRRGRENSVEYKYKTKKKWNCIGKERKNKNDQMLQLFITGIYKINC